jgi:hypothetical protein
MTPNTIAEKQVRLPATDDLGHLEEEIERRWRRLKAMHKHHLL